MTRWSPPPPRDGEHFFPLGSHDAVSLSLFVACVAATVAIASSMCSACGRKPKAVSQEPDAAAAADAKAGDVEEEVVTLPPELAIHGPIEPAAPVPASRRKLSVSMSVSHAQGIAKNIANIPDKMRLSKRERKEKQDAPEDTLWKKAIILGEKCKIPGEREGEVSDVDAAAEAADEMAAGTFRRSSYSRPMSRSSSFAVNQPLPEPPAYQSSSNS
uniref:Uncharacterized protein n=1 Tax=Avena sativa TaxID=4498 RepID=A0ACD5XWG5_AVESA